MIGALAFTHGHDIYFAPGQYQPDTLQGRQLIAHELSHVIQQRAGRVPSPALESGKVAVVQDQHLEAEAERLGRGAAVFLLARQAASRAMMPIQARPAALPPRLPVPSPTPRRPSIVQPGIGKNKKLKTKKAKGHKRLSKAYMDRELKGVTKPSAVTFTGRWTGKTKVSGTKSFTINRGGQMLRQISTQLFWHVKDKLSQNKEQEVQSMLVNDRILVAANLDGSLTALADALKEDVKGYAQDLAATQAGQLVAIRRHPLRTILESDRANDERATGYGRKLSGVFGGRRLAGDINLASLIASVSTADFFQTIDISTAPNCQDAITNANGRHKIIFVTGGGGEVHAEQKLLTALVKSGYAGQAQIYGKKRPCVGCFLTLTFVREKLGKNISYNTHPGGYWATALPALLETAQRAIESGGVDHATAVAWLHDQAVALQTYQTHALSSGVQRSTLVETEENFGDNDDIDVDRTGYDTGSDSEPD
jgi:hypothetical protein